MLSISLNFVHPHNGERSYEQPTNVATALLFLVAPLPFSTGRSLVVSLLSSRSNAARPPTDFEDMGNCAVVVTDGMAAGGVAAALATAAALADSFAQEFWARRDAFGVDGFAVPDAVAAGRQSLATAAVAFSACRCASTVLIAWVSSARLALTNAVTTLPFNALQCLSPWCFHRGAAVR